MKNIPEKDETIWLVKSGDRILGPYSGEEIKNKLHEKELVVIDEVVMPMRRWRYIRDEPAFALVVEEVRKSHLSMREDTATGNAGTQTGTNTGTTDIAEESMAHHSDDHTATLTPTPTSTPTPEHSRESSDSNTAINKGLDFSSVDIAKANNPHATNANRNESSRASESGSRNQSQSQNQNRNQGQSSPNFHLVPDPNAPPPRSSSNDVDARSQRQGSVQGQQAASGGAATSSSSVQDAVVISETTNETSSPRVAVKSYGYGDDHRVRQDLSRISSFVWTLTIMILIGVGGIFWRIQSQKTSQSGVTNVNALVNQAREAWSLGDFQGALTLFKKVSEFGYQETSQMIDWAILQIRFGDYVATPIVLLETAPFNRLNPVDQESRLKLTTLQGLAYLIEATKNFDIKKFDRARAFFKAALETDPRFIPALFNKSVTDYFDPGFELKAKRTELVKAFEHIAEIAAGRDPTVENASRMMVALVSMKDNGDKYMARDMVTYLDNHRGNLIQFWQEATLLRAAAFARAEDLSSAEVQMRFMLRADPYVTDEHFVDPLLFTAPLEWHALQGYCEDAVNAIAKGGGRQAVHKQPDPVIYAAQFYCQYKAGERREEARANLRNLEKQYPLDPLFRGLAAYVVMPFTEDDARARVSTIKNETSMDSIGEIEDWGLLKALRGRLCKAGDNDCLIESAEAAYSLSPKGAYLFVAAARGAWAKANEKDKAGSSGEAETLRDFARTKMVDLEKTAPHYVPFLKLRAEMRGR